MLGLDKVDIKKLNVNRPGLEELYEDFLHPNPNISAKASHKMVSFWPQASMERWISNLNRDDIEIRRRSVKALSLFGEDALPPMIKMFSNSKDLIVRMSCLKVLVKIAAIEKYDDFPKPLRKVIDIALVDESPQIILALVSLLRQLGSHGLPILIAMARDKNILRAKSAVTAIGEINDSNARNFLLELSEESSLDDLIKESIFFSLENFQNLELTKWNHQ